jgi:hypothetical protein
MLDENNEISYLLGPWGAVRSAKAAAQIDEAERKYFVLMPDGFLAEIRVTVEEGARCFRTVGVGISLDCLDLVAQMGA